MFRSAENTITMEDWDLKNRDREQANKVLKKKREDSGFGAFSLFFIPAALNAASSFHFFMYGI